MPQRKSLSVLDLPNSQWEWATFARELLLEIKLKCKDPIHPDHLALIDEFLAHNEGSDHAFKPGTTVDNDPPSDLWCDVCGESRAKAHPGHNDG